MTTAASQHTRTLAEPLAASLRLRSMDEVELQDAILRLRRTLRSLAFTQTDAGIRARDAYLNALNAALDECRRRAI